MAPAACLAKMQFLYLSSPSEFVQALPDRGDQIDDGLGDLFGGLPCPLAHGVYQQAADHSAVGVLGDGLGSGGILDAKTDADVRSSGAVLSV